MWRVWYLKHRVREILENKDGVGVVEIILIYGCTDFTCRYIQISAHESGRDDFREDYKREQRYLKGEVTVYLSLVFTYFICRSNAGKCLFTECKKLQKSRYDTGGGKYICRVSEGTLGSLRNFCAGRKL